MAGFNSQKAMQGLQTGLQTAGGLMGVAGSLYGAYKNVPQAQSNKPYMALAAQAGNTQFKASSMDGLMSQWNNTPVLPTLSGKDLYNPSGSEMFGSLFGAGMGAYQATDQISSMMKGKFGSSDFAGGAKAPTTGDIQTEINEIGIAPQDRDGGEFGDPYNVDEDAWDNVGAWGGPLYGLGGSLDFGTMASTATNLAMAGVGIGLNYLGIKNQMKQAEQDAKEYNAMRLYANQLQQHNFNEAVNDTKNNMFNMQALQMRGFGGDLQTQGADFPLNGNFNIIGAGGTHEANPMNGVPQGISPDGRPNLVEENEVVWNDYVFSHRLTVPQKVRSKYKLRDGITFSEAAIALSEEAKERPNDPISQNGIEAALSYLQESQEDVRMKKQAREVKAAIAEMTPEQLNQLMQTLGGGQSEALIGADGGYLFKDGGPKGKGGKEKSSKGSHRQSKSEAEAAKKRDDSLYSKRLDQLSEDELRYIAKSSQFNGIYDDTKFNTTTAKQDLYNFLIKNSSKVGGYNGLTSLMDTYKKYNRLEKLPDYKYTEQKGYSMSPEDWTNYFNELSGYGVSKAQRTATTQGKYNADPRFNTKGKTTAQVEADPNYVAFKRYVMGEINKYRNGEAADENVLRYLEELDKGINTSTGAAHLLQYNEDGTIKKDANGKTLISDGAGENGAWIEDKDNDTFWHRAFDGVGGINHFYNGVPEITNTKIGERYIYRMDGKPIEITKEQLESNPYLRQIATSDERGKDKDGNDVVTHYIDIAGKDFSEEYTPEPEDEIPPMLPTSLRYAPVLGAFLGSLPQKPKDYSTMVTPNRATYQPIGDYLPYMPVDSQRYINSENQQAAAQLNAIMNATSGNRNAALAQAAYANRQRQQGIAERMQGIEGINFDRLKTVADFNRGTNQFNAAAFNQAELANLQNNQFNLAQAQQNAKMRYAVDKDIDEARSASLDALFDSLGSIGRENFAMNQANSNKALDYQSWWNGISSHKDEPTATEKAKAGSVKVVARGGKMLTKKRK